mmetsp:Transcript_13258/g.42766  ORF Transcript_13258/g.42766 Transcript_13258/m.42766 type:complete len:98 (-) Transcript_13258:21-314(-)
MRTPLQKIVRGALREVKCKLERLDWTVGVGSQPVKSAKLVRHSCNSFATRMPHVGSGTTSIMRYHMSDPYHTNWPPKCPIQSPSRGSCRPLSGHLIR